MRWGTVGGDGEREKESKVGKEGKRENFKDCRSDGVKEYDRLAGVQTVSFGTEWKF